MLHAQFRPATDGCILGKLRAWVKSLLAQPRPYVLLWRSPRFRVPRSGRLASALKITL